MTTLPDQTATEIKQESTEEIKRMDRCDGNFCHMIGSLAQELNRIRGSESSVEKQRQRIKVYLTDNEILSFNYLEKSTYIPGRDNLSPEEKKQLKSTLKSFYLDTFATLLQKMQLTEYLAQKKKWDDTIRVEFKAKYDNTNITTQWEINPISNKIYNFNRKGYRYEVGIVKDFMRGPSLGELVMRKISHATECKFKDKAKLIEYINGFHRPMSEMGFKWKLSKHYDCTFNVNKFKEDIEKPRGVRGIRGI